MKSEDLKTISELISNSNHITVFTGAGISVNSGIPDFRGSNGLYSMVKKKYDLPYPEAIFDLSYFKKNPVPFFDLTKDLVKKSNEPTTAHKFIAYLEEIGKINIVMTQNIDMLHQKAGSRKVVECHGTYETSVCLKCRKRYKLNEIIDKLEKGSIPYCQCSGIIKPEIVFFGEQMPESFFDIYNNPPETDLLLVFGSSLMVQPASSFALQLTKTSKSIIVNLTETESDYYFDFIIHEDADVFCKKVWDELLTIN
jgi:NAD-dependent SIR2 family protein deacetylase